MKIKIFLFWLVAIMTLPLYMGIPVVGKWLVVIFIAGPMLLPILKWAFSYHEGAEHLNFQSSNTNEVSRASQQEAMNQQDMLARLDSRFDYSGKYH